MNNTDSNIQEIYNIGLNTFNGDADAARDFTAGFLKEAAFGVSSQTAMQLVRDGGLKSVGMGVGALALGLGIHGISSAMNAAGTANLRSHFETALSQVTKTNTIVADAESSKVRSYAETIFKFAPHVAADVHLLNTLLVSAVHGEGIDPTIIKNVVDLEAKITESRKNSLFTPKAYS